MPPDRLSKLFKRGTTLALPDDREPALRRLADLDLVVLEEYRYVKCVNPLDPDQKYLSQVTCSGRIRLHVDWDEDDWAYQCPNCGRQVFPRKKTSYEAISVTPSFEGMRALVRQQLETLDVPIQEEPDGLFCISGKAGKVHVCLVDCCPDKSLLQPNYYNDKTAYVVGNERGYQRVLRRLNKPVFGLAGLALGDGLEAFVSVVREMAALEGIGPVRPAILTLEDPTEAPSSDKFMWGPGDIRITRIPHVSDCSASSPPAFCDILDRNGRAPLSQEKYGEVVGNAASYDLFIDMTKTVEGGRYSAGRRTSDGQFEEVRLKKRLAAIWLEFVERRCALRPHQLNSVSVNRPDKLIEQARRELDVNISRYQWQSLHTGTEEGSEAKQFNFNPPDGFRMAILLPLSPPASVEKDDTV